MSQPVTFDARPSGISLRDEPGYGRTVAGWALILVLCSTATFLVLIGRGGLLNLTFPALATGVGLYLFSTNRALFLGFSWWLWFLTPEVRRFADFQGGYNAISPIMVTPLLVSGLTFFTLCAHAPQLRVRTLAGFIPVIIAIFYGTIVGIITTGLVVALYSLLIWVVPVLTAIYVAIHWQDYPKFRATLVSTFGWGAFVMGAYGIFQYFIAPGWDTYWLINNGMITQGHPFPQEIRVFSTMNSSGPFAFVLSAGLLLLLIGGGRFRLPMAGFGVASLLLSLVRAAWMGWALGFVYLLVSVRGRRRVQLVAFAGLAVAAVVVSLLSGSVEEVITKRFETLTDLDDDGSFQQRRQFYLEFLSRAVTNVLGSGIGSSSYVTKLSNFGEISGGFYGDSGFMQIPFVLGWFGGFLYVAGIISLMTYTFIAKVPSNDVFLKVSRAIVLMLLAEMVFENTLINVMGVCYWTFLGMGLAGRRFHALHITDIRDDEFVSGTRMPVPRWPHRYK
jgi:hypothetical protein